MSSQFTLCYLSLQAIVFILLFLQMKTLIQFKGNPNV